MKLLSMLTLLAYQLILSNRYKNNKDDKLLKLLMHIVLIAGCIILAM